MRLSRLVIISLVVAMLVVGATQALVAGDFLKRGPVAALAEGEDEIWWSNPQPIADDPVIYDPEPVADDGGDQVAWGNPQPIADDQPQMADNGGDTVAWTDPSPIVDRGGYSSSPVSYGQGTYGQGTAPAPRPQPQIVYQPYPVYQPPQTVYVDRQPITQEVRQEVNVDNRTDVDVNVEGNDEDRNRRRRDRRVREIIREVPVTREIVRDIYREVTRDVVREVPVTRFATVDRPIYVPVSQPYVVEQPRIIRTAGSEVKELPKTGLPLASLALAGLLPVGWRLRRFGQSPERISANSIWENRQFAK